MLHASLAVENSGGTNASCISQLAHCFRLLSCCPKSMLKNLGIDQNEPQEFSTIESSLFQAAYDLEPHRRELEKDEPWRQKERQLLDRIK